MRTRDGTKVGYTPMKRVENALQQPWWYDTFPMVFSGHPYSRMSRRIYPEAGYCVDTMDAPFLIRKGQC